MTALSALVFALSWWLGLYLVARDPRKLVLVLASVGLTSFALVVALDAVRLVSASELLSRIEIYLVAVPGYRLVRGSAGAVATPRQLAQPCRRGRAGGRASRWSRSPVPRWRATSRARCGWGTG